MVHRDFVCQLYAADLKLDKYKDFFMTQAIEECQKSKDQVDFYQDLITALNLKTLTIFIPSRSDLIWSKLIQAKKILKEKIHFVTTDSLNMEFIKLQKDNEKFGFFVFNKDAEILPKIYQLLSHSTWFWPSVDKLDDASIVADTNTFTYEFIKDGIEITQVYYKPNSLIYKPWGLWTSNFGLLNIEGHLSETRRDMTNIVIRVTTISHHPQTILETFGEEVQIRGYLGDILSILSETLNFSSVVTPSIDNQWGLLENGSWNGMIGMLERNESDIAVAPLVLSDKRAAVTRFSTTVFQAS